jgi:DNA-binding NarL/FixJ family response regulator
LIVVDISLNDSNGIELISEIKACHSGVKTVVWSMFDENVYAERALRAGAAGYVNKTEPIERIVEAIRKVLDGEMCLSPQMSTRLLRRMSGGVPVEEDPVDRLSNRELEVFRLIGQGKATKQIARKLNLSHKTVETHREKIKTKLGVDNAAELSLRAFHWALENS